jgi:hypothetical protein
LTLVLRGNDRTATRGNPEGGFILSILWIILIVVLVLALLGFFSRGAW